MLKRTLFFGKPYYLSLKNNQLCYQSIQGLENGFCPVEDLGIVVLENARIRFSMSLMEELVNNNVAVVFCGSSSHYPHSMLLNLDSHSLQTERFMVQIEAKLPLKKKLWKKTVCMKIQNQYLLLKKLGRKFMDIKLLMDTVKSGDSDNREAVAARIYWKRLFSMEKFTRNPDGSYPNNLLNYGYSILRAATARALAGSGLLATLGIHHRNRYNAFCLADDLMEPYRPFVDEIVCGIIKKNRDIVELNPDIKRELLSVLSLDTLFNKVKRPLFVGLTMTTASLVRSFQEKRENLSFPKIT